MSASDIDTNARPLKSSGTRLVELSGGSCVFTGAAATSVTKAKTSTAVP
ncbi:hypothetical protein LWC34_47030 [Kibdelosporangium philippinense]|uniref:Uncharacterized protein n=1 Tax=Kibdelosporangium philippinense TaxID=211113 RepID=A0ABS8ZRI0_9PSEU|nr:hypothetical protein [Kibdelosporangium philippinense]MCE7010310.1 hypothetical protein [Kibdelosporangium philippinense]